MDRDEEFTKYDKVGCDFTVLSALDRRGNVDKNFQPPRTSQENPVCCARPLGLAGHQRRQLAAL